MVTSEQVARLAGVSRATVSRVLNGSPRISEEARARVHAAMAELGYEPDVVAQSLVRQRSRVIALGIFQEGEGMTFSYLGRTQHYFYLDVLKAIEQEATSAGYDLLLPSRPLGSAPEHYIRALRMRRVAGTIMMATHRADPRVQELLKAHLPTVFLDNMIQSSHASYVKGNNIDGARQATAHLLSLGHRRIAFLTGPASGLPSTERLLGSQQALAQIGVEMDPALIRQSGWNTDEAYSSMKSLLAERRDFTAVVAGSDLMAIGILQALHEEGVQVPKHISLTGFDDVDLSQYTFPPLTTVCVNREALGKGAVQMLLQLIEGQTDLPPLIVPASLIVRGSTGPASSM